MKQFFKFMFASMLGFFLSFVIIFFFLMAIVISAASFSKKEVVLTPSKSVIHVTLAHPIPERSSENPFDQFNFSTFKAMKKPGLNEILADLKKAKTDENIKGIVLELKNIPSGMATIEEVRNALLDFKTSGKFIYSYGEYYTQKAYYLASVSDRIYINPEGMLDFRGLSAEVMFLKNTLKKLDIEPQVFRHGKYKSAGEPFIEEKMSKANREQMQAFVDAFWNHMLTKISMSRSIPIDRLNAIADGAKIETPDDALEYKFVDKIAYKDEFLADLRANLELKENAKINMLTLNNYSRVLGAKKKRIHKKDKIAVIYTLGLIGPGEGDSENIGSEKMSKVIRKARKDSTIKAIVLRVNSPGGSALASDVILRELKLAKQAKPVVVSMGDVAASGGYYIACEANKIVAQPNTLTGSIGVIGMVPNMQKFFSNKLGITFDNVKTNKYADFPSGTHAMNTGETRLMENALDRVYDTFLQHVADGRNMTVNGVDSIAQGRIWSGIDAVKVGLVDTLGGIDMAVKVAAKLANIEEYKMLYLPKQKDLITQIIEDLSGEYEDAKIKNILGDNYAYFKTFETLSKMKGVQARLPFELIIY